MLTSAFHSAGRHDPSGRRQIDFAPSRAANFSAPCRSQNGEPQRLRADTMLIIQGEHEVANLTPGESRMMLHLPDLRTGGERQRKMSLPGSRVLARTPA